jgi:hypothetical protein
MPEVTAMRKVLTPREHGTYAQLAFPLLSGLIVGGATLAGVALALSVVCAFLAYEPAAVLLGLRGMRLQREQHGLARRQLVLSAATALLLAGLALPLAPPRARLLLLLPATLAALLATLLPARRVKTIAGETVAAAALASMHLPLAAAAGVAGVALWGPALVWFVAFFLATLAVHAIKARQKQRDPWLGPVALGSTIAVAATVVALAVRVPALRLPALARALPLSAVLAVNLARVHPRALKRVGWALVASDVAALALLALL